MPPQACAQQAPYLGDHGKAHDEETNAAAQSEDRLVCAQVLGELVRDGGHYGLDCGKLEQCQQTASESNCPTLKAPKSPLHVSPGKSVFGLGLVF